MTAPDHADVPPRRGGNRSPARRRAYRRCGDCARPAAPPERARRAGAGAGGEAGPGLRPGLQRGGAGVIRSLGAAGVPVVAVWHAEREIGRHSRHVGLSARAPHAWDEPARYVRLLRELGRRTGGGNLFPTTDEAVTCVARASRQLEREHILACPPWEVAERFLNKRLTLELAERHGIDAPATGSARTREELEQTAAAISFPCCSSRARAASTAGRSASRQPGPTTSSTSWPPGSRPPEPGSRPSCRSSSRDLRPAA